MEKEKQQKPNTDRQLNTEDIDDEIEKPNNELPQGTAIYTPLTVFNTRLATSKTPLHSPKLPYPYENWPDDTFTGQYDTSQCILASPSAMQNTDLHLAREHLKQQLEKEPNSHPQPQPIQRPTYTLRNIPRPTYDVDALLQLTDFATTQMLWTLKKRKTYSLGIGHSCLPGAQRGLFTIKEREDNEFLCPYLGPIIKCDPTNTNRRIQFL